MFCSSATPQHEARTRTHAHAHTCELHHPFNHLSAKTLACSSFLDRADADLRAGAAADDRAGTGAGAGAGVGTHSAAPRTGRRGESGGCANGRDEVSAALPPSISAAHALIGTLGLCNCVHAGRCTSGLPRLSSGGSCTTLLWSRLSGTICSFSCPCCCPLKSTTWYLPPPAVSTSRQHRRCVHCVLTNLATLHMTTSPSLEPRTSSPQPKTHPTNSILSRYA